MREKEFACAPGLDEAAIGGEFHHRRQIGAFAVIGAATVHQPDMTLMVHRHRTGRTHGAAGRQLQKIIRLGIGIGIGIGVGVGMIQRLGMGGHRHRRQNQGSVKNQSVAHHSLAWNFRGATLSGQTSSGENKAEDGGRGQMAASPGVPQAVERHYTFARALPPVIKAFPCDRTAIDQTLARAA